MTIKKAFLAVCVFIGLSPVTLQAQSARQLTMDNIHSALEETLKNAPYDSTRPAYHLIPDAGFMADPNGGMYYQGWYHIFFLYNPFSDKPGPFCWGHARSRDLVNWEFLKPALLPAYDLGLNEIGSGSTLINEEGKPIAIYSTVKDGEMKFWRATGSGDLAEWHHEGPNPVMSLGRAGLPKFDVSWRDPFVFRTGGRTFMICCADLFEDTKVNVPIFEARDKALTDWEYKGILFSYPKNRLRNLEVPELRQLGNKWLLMASCDAPVDMTYGFVGDFDLKSLKFTASSEGPLDYSGHFYAQETLPDDRGNLSLIGWIPGWDRDWMPNYQASAIKNTGKGWNGCFSLPRKLTLDSEGNLIQQPVEALRNLRTPESFTMKQTPLPVKNVISSVDVLQGIRGNQLEINAEFDLGTASFCGMNVLCDKNGTGGMCILWSGNEINVDGIRVPIREWKPGKPLQLQVFVDREYVETFINGGRYCVTRKIMEQNIKGDHVALTRLGGNAVLNSLEAWKLKKPDPLASGFANPPASAWPWVYCFWLDGNVTKEGITADLEGMKHAGIGGALIMDGSLGNPKGPVRFFSPEWQDLFSHMLKESDRLGLEINMNNDPGWAGSGGAWVKPEQAAQRVVCSETRVTGPTRFRAILDKPPVNLNTYRDIAVLAFPAPKTDAKGNFSRLELIKSGKSFDSRGDFAECVPWPRSIHMPAQWQTLPSGHCVPLKDVRELSPKMGADGKLEWDVPPGDWVVMRIGYTPTGAGTRMAQTEAAGLECDKLSKTALKAHYDAMVGKLINDAGPLAGKTLVSTHIDSWEAGSGNWTQDFREEFKRRRGYDPLNYLPVLNGIMVESPEISERFLWDLRETINDLVLDNYAGALKDLAAEKGLRLSIEAYDGTVDDLRYAGRADEPMTEFWQGGCYAGLNLCDLTEEMTSAAHVYGKKIVGAEAYSAWVGRGWADYPATLKPLGDWALGQGVNRFCISEWIMQPWTQRSPGVSFSNIGTQYGRTLSWWEQSKAWHEYLARCQFLLRQGLFVADVCFLEPEGAPNRFVPPIPATFRTYPPERPSYNFDGCPAEVVLTRMSVRDGRIVLPDGMNYRLLVLPTYNANGQPVMQLDSTTYSYSARPMVKVETMTPALLRKIKELVEAGATVLGTRPLKSPGLSGYPECDSEIKHLADEIWGKDAGAVGEGFHELGKGRVIWGKTPEQVLADLKVTPDFDCGAGQPFRAIHRTAEDGTEIYFVSNKMDRMIDRVCTFRIQGKTPELWMPESGRTEQPALYTTDASGLHLPVRLEPNESVFVVFHTHTAEPDAHFVRILHDGKEIGPAESGQDKPLAAGPLLPLVNTPNKPYPGVWNTSDQVPLVQVFRTGDGEEVATFREGGTYEFLRSDGRTQKLTVPAMPPAMQLDGPWNLQFNAGLGAPEQVKLEKLISWHQHNDPGIKYYAGQATYRKTFTLPDAWLKSDRRMVLDLGRVMVMATVRVNGHDLGILWRAPFRLDITPALVPGVNSLEVTVANLPVNRMIGDEQLPADSERGPNGELKTWPQWLLDGKPSPAGRFTFSSWNLYKKEDPLMESGLLGPVRLDAEINLTIPN